MIVEDYKKNIAYGVVLEGGNSYFLDIALQRILKDSFSSICKEIKEIGKFSTSPKFSGKIKYQY